MATRIKSDRILTPQGVSEGYVYFEGEYITHIGREELPYEEEIDAKGLYVSPGLIDIHTHGAMGVDYGNADSVEDINRALAFQVSHGATTVLPTVTSSAPEVTDRALKMLAEAIDKGVPANVPGVHLEGPFLSLKQAGAQDPKLITEPREEFYLPILEKYGRYIARWDYAPERDEGHSFARILTERGILPSAAHTDAEYEDIKGALENGMSLITHLYSCTSTITRHGGFRHLGVIESAYLFDELYIELICDGKHLPPELLKLIFKIKPHEKIILCTDSLMVAGIDAKEARVGTTECIIEDGICKLRDRSAFAGSIATADRLLRVATKEAGLPIPEAVKMLTENPARLLKLDTGSLEVGKRADIITFDEDIEIHHIILGGTTPNL